jgi:hypothetical protein
MKINLNRIKTISIKERKSKVNITDFCLPGKKNARFAKFYDSLPDILAAKEFKQVVDAILKAKKNRRVVIFMLGAHVIKCGLSALIVDLLKKGVINCISLNGAGAIHDFEVAAWGHTSEDVAQGLKDGTFGMVQETADFINGAAEFASQKNLGLGQALGMLIGKKKLLYREFSILHACHLLNVPCTVHVAVGTDITHQHPSCDGASLGKASLEDFYRLIEVACKLKKGAVVTNIGSAVILPEVFLKALNLARNLGFRAGGFTAVNFDMFYQYRPLTNVVTRPLLEGGRGLYIIGHHELMLPLLHQAIIEGL